MTPGTRRRAAPAGRGAACLLVVTASFGPGRLECQTPIELTEIALDALRHDAAGVTENERTTRLLRVPVGFTLKAMDGEEWGVRLRVAGTFAVHDFANLSEILDDPSVRTTALVPGIEVLAPLGKTSTIRPFLDLGVGADTKGRVAALIGSVGARAELLFLADPFRYGLEPLLQYNLAVSSERTHSFGNGSIRALGRRALGFELGGHRPDAGLYVEAGYFYDELEFTVSSGDAVGVRNGYELGFTTGFFYPRPKIWLFTVPRLWVGYRFGQTTGLRIRLGGDFVRPLRD
jgi:hypothetical protein